MLQVVHLQERAGYISKVVNQKTRKVFIIVILQLISSPSSLLLNIIKSFREGSSVSLSILHHHKSSPVVRFFVFRHQLQLRLTGANSKTFFPLETESEILGIINQIFNLKSKKNEKLNPEINYTKPIKTANLEL